MRFFAFTKQQKEDEGKQCFPGLFRNIVYDAPSNQLYYIHYKHGEFIGLDGFLDEYKLSVVLNEDGTLKSVNTELAPAESVKEVLKIAAETYAGKRGLRTPEKASLYDKPSRFYSLAKLQNTNSGFPWCDYGPQVVFRSCRIDEHGKPDKECEEDAENDHCVWLNKVKGWQKKCGSNEN